MRLVFARVLTVVLAVAGALSMSGCLLQPTESPNCGAAAVCGVCVANYPGCGWCGSSNTCVPGSTFGPDEVDCLLSTWRFAGCGEPSDALGCAAKDECGSCLYELGGGAPDCTWCAGRGECIPSGSTCVSGVPVTDYDMCSEQNCAAQGACGACLAANCDWCDQGGGSCVYSASGCNRHYSIGFASSGSCPPPNRCSSHAGCSSCLGDPACGWCDAPGVDGYCQASNGWSDYADWCSSGSFYTDFCPS